MVAHFLLSEYWLIACQHLGVSAVSALVHPYSSVTFMFVTFSITAIQVDDVKIATRTETNEERRILFVSRLLSR